MQNISTKSLRVYHGTTLENFKKIRKGGFTSTEKNWTVSQEMGIGSFFWNAETLNKTEGDSEEKEIHEMNIFAAQRAFESGQVALIQSKKSKKVVVLEIDLNGAEFKDDYSCKNMDGAIFVAELNLKNLKITNAWASEDISEFKPFILKGFLQNSLFRLNRPMTWGEKTISKTRANFEYFDDLSECAFKQIKL